MAVVLVRMRSRRRSQALDVFFIPTPELLVFELEGINEPKILELPPEAPLSEVLMSALNEEQLEINDAEDEESLDIMDESGSESESESESLPEDEDDDADEAGEFDAEDDEME